MRKGMEKVMKAVLTVVGQDKVGILAKVSTCCAQYNVNVLEVSQSILSELFCMIMVCDIEKMSVSFGDFSDALNKLGEEMGMSIHTMHEDIFNSMHRI